MKKFILHLILRGLTFPILVLFCSGLYLEMKEIPIHYTNSISLNAKLFHAQKIPSKQLDIIAVGSSMTLNNINTQVITDKLTENYYNFSAWGLTINQTRQLSEFYVREFKPKLLICSTTTGEFNSNIITLPSNLQYVFTKSNLTKLFYSGVHLRQSITEYDDYQAYSKDRKSYTSLFFDIGGGVPLNIDKENIITQRWNEIPSFDIAENQYDELILLSDFLRKNNVTLVLIHATYRGDAIQNLDLSKLNAHLSKCSKILADYNHIFLNYSTDNYLSLHQEYYTDVTHLNEKGSKIFTQKIVNNIDSLGLLNK